MIELPVRQVKVEDVVQETTREDAIERMSTTFRAVEESGQLDAVALQKIADSIMMDVIDRKENLLQLTDIRLHDKYTFAHSVNVAIISAMIGGLLKLPKDELSILTLGGLLHDLGKIKVASEILNKNGRLNDDEFNEIKHHPIEGARRIEAMASMLPKPDILARIAREHHEHLDGTGYPDHKKENEIHKFSKVVAIADVYDALTSERSYKKPYTPSVTRNIMMNLSKGHFDENLIRLFFNNVAVYPVGTILKTIYGLGIVTKCEFGHTETPSICVFADVQGKMLDKPERIDLKDDGTRAIEMEVSGIELLHFIHHLTVNPMIYLTEEA